MFFFRPFRFIRLFSLDIVAGALAALTFTASVMGVELHRSYYTIMALSVWLIYTADHLMDGAKTHGSSESEKGNFFYSYKIPIILVFLIILVLDFRLIVYRLDEKIIQFGMGPGIATVIYLLLNRYYENAPKWFFIKEVWIAIIYTLAIWGGPVIFAGDKVNPSQVALLVSSGLIIFGNVIIYSIYEREADAIENNKSMVKDFGLKNTMNTAVFALSVSILFSLAAYVFYGSALIFFLPLVLISSMMLVILSSPRIFSKSNYYGILADLLILLFFLVLIG
jgi:4-hydroxybenzoate polyprenyltransferase